MFSADKDQGGDFGFWHEINLATDCEVSWLSPAIVPLKVT
jgi:hypothetical protein